MKKTLLLSGMTLLLAASAARAQSTNIVFPPGKIAVFKAGDNTGIWNISSSKVQPCFIQAFDPVTTNQSTPIYSQALPTNAPGGLYINAHAGSEGGGISRTVNRQFFALEGYTGNILSPSDPTKPSANLTVNRGIVTLDAFGNETPIYSDLANWFGLPPGVTQNNPTGIASTDGTNFWGTGNVTGTSSEAAGTLFLNLTESTSPLELQNFIQAAAEARIIGGTLYIVVPGQGVYNFLDPQDNDNVVPLPFDPDVPNPVEHIVLTNLFLNWGATFKNVANFDMNAQGTIAYGADQTFGVVKFTNSGGVWSQAYLYNSNNIGTAATKAANQGCFGICVDFSGTNPVIYATTMENGTSPVNNSQGNPNQNRLIRIVDTGVAPSPSVLVATTLATAQTTNENFRGIDFTPDLRPQIDSEPANFATTNGGSATFTVVADSVYPLSYQWLQSGASLGSSATNPSVTLTSFDTNFNGLTYQCIVSNQFGAVTSTPAVLTVTALPVAPTITNSIANVSAFIGGKATFAAISPTGTQPFTYQWYQGTTQLTDDGIKYFGSTSNSLTIANLGTADAGNYYLVAFNSAGFASNVVDVLTVNFHKANITAGDPQALTTTFVGLGISLVGTQSGGTLPITNQWYKGASATTVTNALNDPGDITGSQSDTLNFSSATTNDAGFYKIVVSNGGGSVTSTVAQVQVLVPPPHSFAPYSNQVYVQTFDSLPDPGSNSVNSINNPMDPGSIGTNGYSLANPFDFAYPVINNNFVGGLGLSNTMPGWYGAADKLFPGVDGITRFGAQNGDQTTGGVIDFGHNDAPGSLGTNRALGLLSTSTTASTTFALKLVNTSTNTLNYASISFTGEMWHNGTGARVMSFGYTEDNTATNFLLTSESISNSTQVSALNFSFPTALSVTAVDGLTPAFQTNLTDTNITLATPWPPGGALWLIWSINYFGSGSGNGYAIDNVYFSASANPAPQPSLPLTVNSATITGPNTLTLSFTNVPGAAFAVLTATNLTPPINWQPVGSTVEVPQGSYSTYQFSDIHATNKARYYKIATP